MKPSTLPASKVSRHVARDAPKTDDHDVGPVTVYHLKDTLGAQQRIKYNAWFYRWTLEMAGPSRGCLVVCLLRCSKSATDSLTRSDREYTSIAGVTSHTALWTTISATARGVSLGFIRLASTQPSQPPHHRYRAPWPIASSTSRSCAAPVATRSVRTGSSAVLGEKCSRHESGRRKGCCLVAWSPPTSEQSWMTILSSW